MATATKKYFLPSASPTSVAPSAFIVSSDVSEHPSTSLYSTLALPSPAPPSHPRLSLRCSRLAPAPSLLTYLLTHLSTLLRSSPPPSLHHLQTHLIPRISLVSVVSHYFSPTVFYLSLSHTLMLIGTQGQSTLAALTLTTGQSARLARLLDTEHS